jgi:carboxypeptidase Q
MAYVEQHLAKRPPVTDPELAKVSPFNTWNTRWPITPLPGHAELAAYFNLDNGSGKIRGIHTEGNVAVAPMFREWLAPFASMGATTVVTARTGGTDHVGLQQIGIPAFQFVQDPLDYSARIHHTNIDRYDHLKLDDLRQAAVIMASLLWQAAESDAALPRMPLPTKPAQTDPFEYYDDED